MKLYETTKHEEVLYEGRIIRVHVDDIELENGMPAKREVVAGKIRFCPECGKHVEHEGGCVVCRHCGYSKCG